MYKVDCNEKDIFYRASLAVHDSLLAYYDDDGSWEQFEENHRIGMDAWQRQNRDFDGETDTEICILMSEILNEG